MLKFLCGSETFVKIVIIVVHLPFAMVILLMSVMFLIDTKQICTEIAWFFFKSLIKQFNGTKKAKLVKYVTKFSFCNRAT